ncbi:helix-turn-helix transcriptional regulator [Cryptosporangium aurantiacum]|uniref:AraC-type DNA-binding protein n=1 Tax=Cryptosporangium aurantiacum TaxID=134849 RepID=A0A1M7KVK3_9ACTN|nr:AraC family transcriptional regulator [Cryptosporangium aurantiacum]SHM69563.1 AraC-type DNA-binding protein [Cryptosporangium aurantiacum]
MIVQIHSAFADPGEGRCSATMSAAAPWLRRYVVGYGGYRALGPGPLRRRMFPMTLTTVLLDADPAARLVTGPRGTGGLHDGPAWRDGVSVGLTPAGVRTLLGPEAGVLADEVVPLDAVGGPRATRLADRIAELPDWPSRVAALDAEFSARLRAARTGPARIVDRAWHRLQDPAGRAPVGTLAAELGVSRRYLELEFRRRIGLSPKTVARVARLQRAVGALAGPDATLGAATAAGYADQSHLSRETRALLGVTPGELFAFVQDTLRAAG